MLVGLGLEIGQSLGGMTSNSEDLESMQAVFPVSDLEFVARCGARGGCDYVWGKPERLTWLVVQRGPECWSRQGR